MTATGIRDSLLAGGWRQGSVLPESLVADVRWLDEGAELPADAVLVVTSQDCDLLHDSIKDEPIIEVVAASRVETVDPNNYYAKNPRRLDINLTNGDGSTESIRLEMRWKGALDRRRLVGNSAPAVAVVGNELRSLSRWLARRSERPALPDEFNQRLQAKNGTKRLRQLLGKAKNGQPLGLFVALGDQLDHEFSASTSYKTPLIVVLEGELRAGDPAWDEFESEVFEPLVKFFNGISGIELINPTLISEQDLPYRQRRLHLTLLDLDSISLASEGVSALPSDL
jgi:hypothetical protein